MPLVIIITAIVAVALFIGVRIWLLLQQRNQAGSGPEMPAGVPERLKREVRDSTWGSARLNAATVQRRLGDR